MSKINKRDAMRINEKFNDNKTNLNNVIFSIKTPKKGQWLEWGCNELGFEIFRKRENTFSLDFRPFGPSVLDGVRSKVDLRDKGYA